MSKNTEQKTAATTTSAPSLSDSEALQNLVRGIGKGFYVTSADGRFLDANAAFLALVGAASKEELQSQTAENLWAEPEKRQEFLHALEQHGSVDDFTFEARRLDGKVITVRDSCYAERDGGGKVITCYGIVEETKASLSGEEPEIYVRDNLTGCYNFNYLETRRADLERPSYFWGCLLFDLDGFKQVNETYGLEEGDAVLVRFTHFINRHKRPHDVLIRVGGDEFALMVEVVSPDNMNLITDRLTEAAPRQSPLAFHVGHAYRRRAESIEQVLTRAAEEMHSATGRREVTEDRRHPDEGSGGAAAETG